MGCAGHAALPPQSLVHTHHPAGPNILCRSRPVPLEEARLSLSLRRASGGSHRRGAQETRLCARNMASEDPPARPPSRGRRSPGSDRATGLLSGPVRVQAASEQGSRKPAWGPRAGPVPPGCRLRLWPRPIARRCHSELRRGESHAGPQQAGPPPLTARPSLPSWQGGLEKAANFKSARRLWSCPELSTINHRSI